MYVHNAQINQSQLLIAIDQFIHAVIYTPMSDQQFTHSLIELIPSFQLIDQENLHYCSSIKTFKTVIFELQQWGIELMSNHHLFLNPCQINFLKHLIITSQIEIEAELKTFSQQERRNRNSLSTYLKQLTQHYAKLLFIRVDLAIQYEYQVNVGIQQFNAYIRTVLKRVHDQDTCFNDLHGYAWAIEQGESKGYHCHLLLVYDGHKHQNDFGLALLVGQYWRELTANQGSFFTSNALDYKRQFEQKGTLGIGMIHRNDAQQVHNAITAAMYLVNPEKEDQYLRAKDELMRTFGRGQYQKVNRRNCVAQVDWV